LQQISIWVKEFVNFINLRQDSRYRPSNELVDVALGINHAQGFDLNVNLHSVDVDDVAPPIVKLSDVKRHASLLSDFLLDNSLHYGVNEILSFQKLSRRSI